MHLFLQVQTTAHLNIIEFDTIQNEPLSRFAKRWGLGVRKFLEINIEPAFIAYD